MNIEKWMLIIVLGLVMIPVGIYTVLKPRYNERLETNTIRLLNDTVLRVDVGSEMYLNYTSFTTYDVPGELQGVNISGVIEGRNRALFLFKVIDGIEVSLYTILMRYRLAYISSLAIITHPRPSKLNSETSILHGRIKSS